MNRPDHDSTDQMQPCLHCLKRFFRLPSNNTNTTTFLPLSPPQLLPMGEPVVEGVSLPTTLARNGSGRGMRLGVVRSTLALSTILLLGASVAMTLADSDYEYVCKAKELSALPFGPLLMQSWALSFVILGEVLRVRRALRRLSAAPRTIQAVELQPPAWERQEPQEPQRARATRDTAP